MKAARIAALGTGIVLLSASAVFATPLKVRTHGGGSQQVVMCPDCKSKITCAKAGDYLIGFTADLENRKTGAGRVSVHVQDAQKKPVTDATVTVALSMPKHGHARKPIVLKHASHGRYDARTQFQMAGAWQANVEVTSHGGDTIKQAFSFSK